MCTGWAKLRYLESGVGLTAERLGLIKGGNALELFGTAVARGAH